MFKKTAIVAGLGLALSATAQADYRWELDAGYARGNYDYETKNTPAGSPSVNDDSDSDIYSVGGTWYMEKVVTSKGPLGEAAVLDHAASLSVGFSDGDISLNGRDDPDGQTYSADMRYVAEGPGWKLSGWLVDIGYERFEPDDREVDTWNLGVGKYITRNTTLVLGYENVNVNNGGDVDRWGLDLEHFFAFNSGGFKARLGGGKTVVSDQDDPTTYTVGGTWYLGNNWGFSGDYRHDDLDGFEVDTYQLGAEWFITESFAVEVYYQDTSPDDFDLSNGGQLETEYDEIGISALLRL
jgi:hypothetical protein